jgi:hypothetical protein
MYTVVEQADVVRIQFSMSNGTHTLVDAIVTSKTQYALWTEDDINRLIDARWQAFLAAIAPVELQVDENGEYVRDEFGNLVPVQHGSEGAE